MPIDILDQPRGGILETTIYYLYKKGSSCSIDSLTEKMTGSKEGEKYFSANVLDLLEAVGFTEVKNDEVYLSDCPILERLPEEMPFEKYFKIELLSKIMLSKEPTVRYFGDVLRKLFDQEESFDKATLEETLRECRGNRGIPVSPGEELGAKLDFSIAFLRYFNLVQKLGNFFIIFVPRDTLKLIFSFAMEDLDKPSVKLFSELFEQIDKNYIPILFRKENRILNAVYQTLKNKDFMESFNFANVPDGGRTVLLTNKEFNAIIRK